MIYKNIILIYESERSYYEFKGIFLTIFEIALNNIRYELNFQVFDEFRNALCERVPFLVCPAWVNALR